jgi:hypothetical protein
MEDQNQPSAESRGLETLQDIKRIMERSSRFISLSGLSGVAAGICALAGSAIAYGILKGYREDLAHDPLKSEVLDLLSLKLGALALATFAAAFISSFVLTWRKARKLNLPVWDE